MSIQARMKVHLDQFLPSEEDSWSASDYLSLPCDADSNTAQKMTKLLCEETRRLKEMIIDCTLINSQKTINQCSDMLSRTYITGYALTSLPIALPIDDEMILHNARK